LIIQPSLPADSYYRLPLFDVFLFLHAVVPVPFLRFIIGVTV